MDRSANFIRLVATATLSLAAALVVAADAGAAEAPPPSSADTFPVRSKIVQAPTPQSVPVYVPPRRGSPKDVSAAATRSPTLLPRLKLLAPDHAGLTVAAQPTLYIYAQGAGWLQVQVRRAADPGAGFTSPRIEVKDPPAIRAISLAGLGVTLEPGAEYRVTVMSYDRAGAVRAPRRARGRAGDPPGPGRAGPAPGGRSGRARGRARSLI